MKANKILFIILLFIIFFVYLIFPNYIIESGKLGYRMVDSYSKEYFIDCETATLYKKKPIIMLPSEKEWIENHVLDLYKDELMRFDKDGNYLKVVTSNHWVDGFLYKHSLFDYDGDLVDIFENITFMSGRYYKFQYSFRNGSVNSGVLSSLTPSIMKTNYSYEFNVGLAKKSCSHPQ
ncbi:hypothetical protein [Rahnella aquatilis]|uniref:hypothetical protein n=1 Tax=Rahnella aquatilis TaxID=34038 RepID=UPI000647249D|nr:hypothetical protein [Rahnella aquatilis]